MTTLDFTRPYSTHDQGSNAQTRFMQDGKKFDINGNLLGLDGRELDAIEDVEALFAEQPYTETVVEPEPVIEPIVEAVIEPIVEPEPAVELEKPKPKARAKKAKTVVEVVVEVPTVEEVPAVEEQTEVDDLA